MLTSNLFLASSRYMPGENAFPRRASIGRQFTKLSSGFGTVNIEAGMIAAGTYQYSLIIDGNAMDTKKMLLTK